MFERIRKIYDPGRVQWDGRKNHYFEGWYFKSVSADRSSAAAVIPGFSVEKDTRHSFIQFYDAVRRKSYYFRYGFEDFLYSKKKFEVSVGKSGFSAESMHLDIESQGTRIKGGLEFERIAPWPVTFLSPGVMGWYSFVPGMECYHGVLSFDHRIKGVLEINGEVIDFTEGRGYCEKDWGVSMPSSWIWLQTNHFENRDISVFASIAKIPFRGRSFTGYIAGFYYKGKIYRFTTYTGAKMKNLKVDNAVVSFLLEDSKYRLEIKGRKKEGVVLAAPKFGKMSTKITESLASEISVEFYRKKRKAAEKIFEGTGENAGLEITGDIKELNGE